MNFTPDIIFKYFGQFDKVVVITFKENSTSYKCFGKDITGIFYYTKAERNSLLSFLKSNGKKMDHNQIKFDILLKTEQTKENLDLIHKDGVLTEDILSVFTLDYKNINKFEIEGLKELELDSVKVDFNFESPLLFFIDFYEKRINDGEILLDFEKSKYAAIKWIVDKNIDPEFFKTYIEDIETGEPKLNVLVHKMNFELELGIPNPDGHKDIVSKHMNNIKGVVEKILVEMGVKKKDYNDPKKFLWLYLALLKIGSIFEVEIYLYSNPKIYLDFDGLMHVFLRHTDVFSVNDVYINKSKFPYQLKDIKSLLRVIIQKASAEIENHFSKSLEQYRNKSIYYNGDYYTLSISGNGRIESFHVNK
ncbi:MAG: hypothetical protein WAT79_11170 [Saprospiraceae bacterium]